MKLNRNFSLLLFGLSFADIGDVLYMVSIISTIFILTDSATVASFVPFTITTAMFISSLLTPILIGKVNLKWLLASSQVGKTILLIILGGVFTHITAENYYLVFIVIGLIAFLDGCANPVGNTLIPHYVKREQLLKANGLADTIAQIIQTIMWFVGSLFLIIINQQQLIWIVGGLFFISSIILCLLENVTHESTETTKAAEQIKAGWKTLSEVPVLKKIVWIELLETIAGTVWIAAILYVFVSDALHVDETWWGFINGAFFVGLIIGSIYCIRYAYLIENKLSLYIFIGSLASAGVTIIFSVNSFPIMALFLSLCVGFFGQIKSIPQQTVIQTSVAKEKLATVYTSLSAIATGIFGVSSLAMGVIADVIGIRVVFLISGFLLILVSLIVRKNKELFIRNTLN